MDIKDKNDKNKNDTMDNNKHDDNSCDRTQNALPANGVEFHRHYATATACAPSRTSLFTGQYPSLHGVTQTNGGAKGADEPELSAGLPPANHLARP